MVRGESKCLLRLLAACSLLSVASCEDPLKDPQRIEEPRLLGVRVATVDDAATVVPGQSFDVEVLVASPDGPLGALLSYRFCVAEDTDRGVPSCAEEPFSEGTIELADGPVVLDAPPSLEDGAHLVLLGVACPESEPVFGDAPLEWTCSGGEIPLTFSFDVFAAATEKANFNPDLSELTVSIAGNEIPLDAPEVAASCAGDAPEVPVDETAEVLFALGEDAREFADGSSERSLEGLQISHFSTGGGYERQYSFVDPTDASEVRLKWDAPSETGAVKHYVVVRDQRGGVSWATFSLCVK